MLPAVIVTVYALAVARVTRLITEDRITEAPRRWLAIRLWAPKMYLSEVTVRWPHASTTRAEIRDGRRALAAIRLDDGAEMPLSVYLLTCPWCASIYVAAAAAPVAYWWGERPWVLVPALALAFSYVTGLLAKIGG